MRNICILPTLPSPPLSAIERDDEYQTARLETRKWLLKNYIQQARRLWMDDGPRTSEKEWVWTTGGGSGDRKRERY